MNYQTEDEFLSVDKKKFYLDSTPESVCIVYLHIKNDECKNWLAVIFLICNVFMFTWLKKLCF